MFKLQTQSASKRGKPVFSLLFDALQALDLSRWFTGSYRLAARESTEDQSIEPSAGSDEGPN